MRAACFTDILSFLFVVLFGWGAPLEEVPRARLEKQAELVRAKSHRTGAKSELVSVEQMFLFVWRRS